MDYLQYYNFQQIQLLVYRFKPCYKWITFNTIQTSMYQPNQKQGFKPCYKWITFNTTRTKESYYK